ncbi:hypothetical protein TEA_028080 [Camellia sinensis var. sinensis]|uniref:Uncharacterized protein n=1 Tax=Camellia sinensis var. sinensis TaxID=542762 RepID=A0A4S4EXH3_CAMSN|nr:hypothetical protein TEA_028080 [Camellia sinensis var. sinensis]
MKGCQNDGGASSFNGYSVRCSSNGNGYTESLDDSIEITVPEDDYGLYAIDILDPSPFVKCVHLTDVYHFHDMIDMLTGCGYKKGTTLFGYGYDFRQSNRIDKAVDGLKEKLETAYKATGGRKVFSKYVSKWICIACPFQGAPGCINDSLLTGLQFVEGFESFFFVKRWTMHQLKIKNPNYQRKWKTPMIDNPEFKDDPEIYVFPKLNKLHEFCQVKSGTLFDNVLICDDPDYAMKLAEETWGKQKDAEKAAFDEAEKKREEELSFGGRTVALPFNFSILKWATGTRKVLNNAQLPKGVSFYNIYGTSFDTPLDVCYGSETSPIEDLPDVCHTMADGFAATERVGVASSHRLLLRDKTVFELIQRWLGISQKVNNHSKTSKVMSVNLD